jgi:hypothetical protein
MHRNKRKSIKDSFEEKTKKFIKNNNDRKNESIRSINGIENLSNEMFYEIFDYLDGCQIYQSFSKLNYRFYQLLNSSSLRLKLIDFMTIMNEDFISRWNEITLYQREKIFSVTFPGRTERSVYGSKRIKYGIFTALRGG